jgi:hypothetical protein
MVCPEFRRNDLREGLVRSYGILYRVLEDAIHILTDFGHGLLDGHLCKTKNML